MDTRPDGVIIGTVAEFAMLAFTPEQALSHMAALGIHVRIDPAREGIRVKGLEGHAIWKLYLSEHSREVWWCIKRKKGKR